MPDNFVFLIMLLKIRAFCFLSLLNVDMVRKKARLDKKELLA